MPRDGNKKGSSEAPAGETMIVGLDLFFTLCSVYATFLFIKWLFS
jgi:hypothetical protein